MRVSQVVRHHSDVFRHEATVITQVFRQCTRRSRSRNNHTAPNGLLDGILGTFNLSKTHAPELVKIDMDSGGGLGGTSEDVFGPLAVMLIGYHPKEIEDFRAFMIDMEADMVKLVCCSGDLLRQPLGKVLEASVPSIEEPRLGTRRAVILSGMTGEEVSEVIGAYNDSGLPETVWAAAVPMNYGRQIAELVEDIYGDHMYLRGNPEAVPK